MTDSANGTNSAVENLLGAEKNGHPEAPDSGGNNLLPQIQEALSVIHGPYSSNDSRRSATEFLERIKDDREAPWHGFTLASDQSQQPVVRHYALSLLEDAVRYRWMQYSQAELEAIRLWVIQLAQGITDSDPAFLRNKIAQLWVEIAKRSWASEWMDMDEILFKLWSHTAEVKESTNNDVYKDFVLFVLETLSDEVFNGEDSVAVMREGVLSKACVEIFTSASTLAEAFPDRQIGNAVRFRDEGWLERLSQHLDIIATENIESGNGSSQNHISAKILAVFKSATPWAVPKSIISSKCVEAMVKCLHRPVISVQLACIEALHALYSRSSFSDEEFLALVCPMYSQQVVMLLQEMFKWSIVDPRDIDEEKYLFAKKFSEMISNLGNFLEPKIDVLPKDCDLAGLLGLFLAIAQSKSFVVSIPVMLTWSRLVRSDVIVSSPLLNPIVAPLLDICTSRLIRYESLPEDTDDFSMMFLLEDIDTVPERHAFLGNYRRYCNQTIESIVKNRRADALYYVLGEVDNSLQSLYDGKPPFTAENYRKHSMPFLQVDAKCTVVEAALKGYLRWRNTPELKSQPDEQAVNAIEKNLEAWCERLLEMNFQDPAIRGRVLQLADAFATNIFEKESAFVLKVLEHILESRFVEQPQYPAYNDAVKELHSNMMHELQRLALKMPDQLLDVYPAIESKIQQILSLGEADIKRQTAYQTFLFTIMIEPEIRLQKLSGFVTPIQELWQTPELNQGVSTFPDFCTLLGLDRIKNFLESRKVHEIEDWHLYQLDQEGQGIQRELESRSKALPLRVTKAFLDSSTNKIEKEAPEYKVTRELWRNSLPIILPNLLKFVSHAHAFHNPANWTGLPPEMRSIVSRILTDRFWQAGISEGTKDDFFARVMGTKSTLEGLASAIRGSVRGVREACYSILYCMSRLDADFYGFSELPGPLAHALFADAHCLSSHQLIALLNVVRLLVNDCPVEVREHFVPPILATCFTQMDAKCVSEWEKLDQRKVTTTDADNLTDEMKEESILRQLTHTAVMMIADFLDPARPKALNEVDDEHDVSLHVNRSQKYYVTLRIFCLTSPKIVEPLLLCLAHTIRMHDTRCCGIVIRVLRSILRDITQLPSSDFKNSIREFISVHVLQALITSLHDPYFVDLHKEIAGLIAYIIYCFSAATSKPRTVLLSLPGVTEESVDKCINYIKKPGASTRQHRVLVLDLLSHLKGKSISEEGRISKSASAARKERSKMQEEFMKEQPKQEEGKRRGSLSLEGVADMFGDGEMGNKLLNTQ